MISQSAGNSKPNNRSGEFLVSVVVPSFNHRRFLPERFASIFAQTYRNIELIVIDDASSDGSASYLSALQSPFPIRVILNQVNSGNPFSQWGRGVAEARGEFVWIAESDDSCRPELIEKLLSASLREPNIGIAYAQSVIIDDQGRKLRSFRQETDEIDPEHWLQDYVNSGRDEAARFLVVRNTIPNASACLFRRTVVRELDLSAWPWRVCGDWMAYARICEHHDVAFIAEPLNFFRRHSTTARERSTRDGIFLAEVYAVQDFIKTHFDVAAETSEAACRSTFRMLNHLLKNGIGGGFFIDDSNLLTVATRFDPRLRERFAGKPIRGEPSVRIETGGSLLVKQRHILVRTFDAWRWTSIRVNSCQGNASIFPAARSSLVAVRRIRALDPQTGNSLWLAENRSEYREIDVAGCAHRVGSSEALEIFAWGADASLHLPLPQELRDGKDYDLEFEIRLSGLSAYEPLVASDPSRKRKGALFILPYFELGGADRFNLDLIFQLTRRFGWAITIVSTHPSRDPWESFFRELTDDIFMLHRFLPIDRWPDFIAYLVESRRTDVVYLSHSEFGYRLVPWLKQSFPGLPVIDLLHLVADDWKQGGYPRMSVEARPLLDGTVTTSRWLKDWLIGKGGEGPRIDVVYTGIDAGFWRRSSELARAARERWTIAADRPVILFAGRFVAQKQPEILRPIVAELAARGRDFQLLIAGDGPQRGWVEEQVCRVYPHCVVMLGAVAPGDMPALMSAADILLLPSQSEGIALVLFEAMSMGVVPVATDVGGQRELVTPDCGRLVPSGTRLAEALVQAVDGLLIDPATRERMSKAARSRVESLFTLDQMGDHVNELFSNLSDGEGREVNWNKLPVRCEPERGLFDDLRDLEADDLAADEWSRQVGKGKWLPILTTKIAAFLRTTPLRQMFRRLENRHGERLGRWILGRR